MLNSLIIGRESEKELFTKILRSNEAALVTVYGRRRVGKTYLITNFFKDKGIFFETLGQESADMKTQLNLFAQEISVKFLQGKQLECHDWMAAMQQLYTQVAAIPVTQKVILFFDELPWLATPKSNFLTTLEYYWNRYFSRMPNMILVVCGSAASWMIDNIISNKGALYGRVTHKVKLKPFSLAEVEQYLIARHVSLERKQILELYMVMGGIPKYLNHIEPGQSVAQIINQQFCSYKLK